MIHHLRRGSSAHVRRRVSATRGDDIEDRPALYAEVRRVLASGGRFVTYAVVLRNRDVIHPVPWARDAPTSFLLSADDTQAALERAGFQASLRRDDTQIMADWFQTILAGPPQAGLD